MKSRARTAEDVEKAYRKGIAEGERNAALFCVYVCLLFLANKAGWRETRLQRFIDFFRKIYGDARQKGDRADRYPENHEGRV